LWPGWLTGIALLLMCGSALAQSSDFQIVWVVVGDVGTNTADHGVSAGKHLFMATDLADLSLNRVNIARVDAEPTVTALHVGDRFCLTSLRITASDADQSVVKGAPLSVSVRQDHRDTLQLESRDDNICMRPKAQGEYPVRFASLLPAIDGSTRGAQIFIRVEGDEKTPSAEEKELVPDTVTDDPDR